MQKLIALESKMTDIETPEMLRRELHATSANVVDSKTHDGGAVRAALPPKRVGTSPQTQPPLPFDVGALAPVISAETVGFHYGKHHKGYFETLAKLVAGTPMAEQTLEEIIVATVRDGAKTKIFNNAAQCWNHNFYWNSLSVEPQAPSGKLAAAIDRDFGSLDKCKAALIKASVDQFGTGWGWLVVDGGRLKAISTEDADVPFANGLFPLLTVDVWEHAYYLDWQNRRAEHVMAVIDGHLNWAFGAKNFADA